MKKRSAPLLQVGTKKTRRKIARKFGFSYFFCYQIKKYKETKTQTNNTIINNWLDAFHEERISGLQYSTWCPLLLCWLCCKLPTPLRVLIPFSKNHHHHCRRRRRHHHQHQHTAHLVLLTEQKPQRQQQVTHQQVPFVDEGELVASSLPFDCLACCRKK